MPAVALPDLSTPLAAALSYAKRGWPVCPLHEPTDSGCSCGRGDCGSVGKHPRTRAGLKDATTDEKTIRQWFARWPTANVALVTGSRSGLVVVDVDPRNGGADTWDTLTADHDADDPTYTVTTGGGGLHVYYQRGPHAIKSKSSAIPPGVDSKGEGGYVVAPPSLHASGARYIVRLDAPVQEIPAWLLARLPKIAPATTVTHSTPAAGTDRGTDRARKYVATMPSAVSGQGGHDATFAVAVAVVKGFDLHGSDARSVLDEYNARCSPPWSDRELDHKLSEAEKADRPTGYLLEAKRTPPPAPVPDQWESGLELDKHGAPVRSLPNLNLILSYHPAWRGVLGRDLFAGRDCFVRRPPWYAEDAPAEQLAVLTDSDEARVLAWLTRTYGPWKIETIRQSIDLVCDRYAFHPVRQYLGGLRWDGVERLPVFAGVYLGAEDDAHSRIAPLRWFISAVRRIYEPGCQCDSMLVLEGNQGIGKSRMLRALAGDEWFSDTIGDIGHKDAADGLRGKWIIEIGELRWAKADEETRKAFLSRRIDHYRPSYGRRTIDVPRTSVFAGTTNMSDWQTDSTGARRYFAVLCRAIDLDAISRDRDQLWAEAVARYQRGEPSWLQPGETADQIVALDRRREVDPWEDQILDWCMRTTSAITIPEILGECLRIDPGDRTLAHSRRVGAVLRAAGWVEGGKERGGRGASRARVWARASTPGTDGGPK